MNPHKSPKSSIHIDVIIRASSEQFWKCSDVKRVAYVRLPLSPLSHQSKLYADNAGPNFSYDPSACLVCQAQSLVAVSVSKYCCFQRQTRAALLTQSEMSSNNKFQRPITVGLQPTGEHTHTRTTSYQRHQQEHASFRRSCPYECHRGSQNYSLTQVT